MVITCSICRKGYSTQYNLNKHIKNVHKLKPKVLAYDETVWNFKCLEDNCKKSFQHSTGLISHLQEDHNFPFEIEKFQFINSDELLAWKASIESSYKCNYYVSSRFKSAKGITVYYNCNRSGKYQPKVNKKRQIKSNGTCKLNRACTSSIKALYAQKIFVTWVKNHYGHSLDIKHLRLPKKDRFTIASKLKTGVRPASILNECKVKLQTEGEINRVNLVTTKDITNIKRSYGINKNKILNKDNTKKDDMIHKLTLKISESFLKLQNIQKDLLTKEVMNQILTHFNAIDNLLSLPPSNCEIVMVNESEKCLAQPDNIKDETNNELSKISTYITFDHNYNVTHQE